MSFAVYTSWAEEYGGNGGTAEREAHCYFCGFDIELHLEGQRFACRLHCRCGPRGRAA